MDLVPAQAQGGNHVGRRVGLGEHVLDFKAGIDVPLGHVALLHGLDVLLGEEFGGLALSHNLHDFKGHLGLQALVHQVGHNAVTGTDNLGNGAGARLNQILGVAQPHVGAVGQAGDLQQVRELGGVGFLQHAPDKVGAQLRQGEGACLNAAQVLLGDAQGRRGVEQRHDLRVAHGDVHHRDAGVVLQVAVDGGHIVSQLVQLAHVVVDGVEVKVGGDVVVFLVVGGVLHRAEVVDLHAPGDDNHAAGVLARGALDARTAQSQALLLRLVQGDALCLGILAHVANGGLVRHGGDGASLEHVVPAKEHLCVAVGAGLVLAGEVQVDVGDLVAVEAQEGLEGDGVAVPVHGGAADGAVLGGQVKAGIHAAVGEELAVLAVGADVVGLQGVHLGDAGHAGHQGGAHGAAGAHQIAVGLAVGHQLLGGHVQHGEAVLDDGVQLLVQTGLDDFGQGVAVLLLGALPGDGHQLLLGALDEGREVAHGHRADVVDLVGDFTGVFHHHLKGLLLPQIAEFLQHLRGGAHVQGRLLVGVVKAAAAHDDPAEVRVLGVFEMDVAGGHHRLVQLLANAHNGAVVLPQALHVGVAVAHHEHVVAQGLDFQVVVVGGDFAQVVEGLPLHHGPEQLAGLAGAAHQQALPVLVQQALGGAGIAVEVVEMSLGDEAVQVFQARVVLHQQNHVVGPQLLGVAAGQGAVYLIHPVDVVVMLEAL